jgi:hypothetical protein
MTSADAVTVRDGRRVSRLVARRELQQRLVAAREGRFPNRKQAAEALGWSARKQDLLEAGEQPLSLSDLPTAFEVLGVPDADRGRWHQLAEDSRHQGWWDRFSDTELSPGAKQYAAIEWGCTRVRTWSASIVPGLLQVDAYSVELLRSVDVTSPEQHDRFRQARQQRRLVLEQPDPLEYHAICDESALLRRLPPGVMEAQIAHIVHVVETHPEVTFQVVPFSAGLHMGQACAYTLVAFDIENDHGLAIVEAGMVAAKYQASFGDVALYSSIFEKLRSIALSPSESLAMIRDRAGDGRSSRARIGSR